MVTKSRRKTAAEFPVLWSFQSVGDGQRIPLQILKCQRSVDLHLPNAPGLAKASSETWGISGLLNVG